MKIRDREIGPKQPPYLIAEIGANHGGSLNRCLKTIDAAKQAGADAVKLQAYEARTITIDSSKDDFFIKDGPWKGKRLWDLYKKCETPFEWFPKIAAHAEAIGITWFASVFDFESVRMLERLGCPAYKIASFEIIDLPLIRYAAETMKPVIVSTGMASDEEIQAAFGTAFPCVMLHCVSEYPAEPKDYALPEMLRYHSHYGVSDHTPGLEIPIAATALGACVIEKHFTLAGKNVSEDAEFSLSPAEFSRMCAAVRNTWAAIQPSKKAASEEVHRPYRRSLYCVADVEEGEEFTYENVRSIRPGFGLPPADIGKVVGKKAARKVEKGDAMTWEMIDAGR